MKKLLNNRYQVIQLLGIGGFGETYLAEDTHLPSRRQCVIKQLKPIANDPQLYQVIQQRFGREAATLESLAEGSEQIPNLYAYFCENGQFYLVQEWIDGQTLTSKVVTEGPLSETVVWEILVNLLPVLNYIHSKGIIYRDIKPDNIILRQSTNQPVLIDFGAVKETMATAINAHGRTTHTMVLGTPGFMAPEQASGRPVYASDIYGLGMTAIYLLTGKLPQELEIDPKTEQIVWRQNAPNVSSGLAAVIERATQYNPGDRYSTAIKMLDALHSVASISPRQRSTQATLVISPAMGKTPRQPAAKTAQQTERAIALAVARRDWQKPLILGSLLIGGLLGAAAIASLSRNQPPQSSIATLPPPDSKPEPPIALSTPAAESPTPFPEPTKAPPAPVTAPAPPPSRVSSPLENKPPTASNNENISSQPQKQQPTAQAPLSPAESVPQQNSEQPNDSASSALRENIPGFPIGTTYNTVKAALGNPTKTSRGVWSNTRAVLYELKPNQITLGYLFDRSSERLRQTEIAFAQSVEPKVIQATLQGMLGDRAADDISPGLQQVYQRQINKYSFTTGSLKGVIERNDSDRIYIGVWDADLH